MQLSLGGICRKKHFLNKTRVTIVFNNFANEVFSSCLTCTKAGSATSVHM